MEGGCLCDALSFHLNPPLRDVVACHCTQCRKTSGHFAAPFEVAEAALDWQARAIITTTATDLRKLLARDLPGLQKKGS